MISIAICFLGLRIADLAPEENTESNSDASRASFSIRVVVLYALFDIGTFIARLSVLLFFGRIFNGASSQLKYALWIVHGLNAACYLGIILMMAFGCSPIRKYWTPGIPGVCLNLEVMYLVGGIPNIVLDFLILLLPLPLLWKLKMPLNRKLLVVGVFVLGYL
jgi:hypothetical protein